MDYSNEEAKYLDFVGLLNGELNSEERKELEKKLANSERLKREFEEFKLMWEDLDKVKVPADLNVDHNLENVLKRIENNKTIIDSSKKNIISRNIYHWQIFNRKRETWGWAIRCAAIIMLSVISYQVFMVDHSPLNMNIQQTIQEYTLYAPKGKRLERKLPDGTKVFLNSDSKLIYDDTFNEFQRSVRLDGEAYFEVAHDADKPFFIQTSSTGIKVLGTKFNVYVRDKDFSLAVVEGKVAAFHRRSDKSMVVEKNEMVESHGASDLSEPVTVNIAQFLDWRNNKLSFRNEPLEKVMKEIEITFNVKPLFKEDSLKDRKLTGSFDATSLENILTAISISLNVDLKRNGNSVLIQ